MQIKITPNDKGNPVGKLADAELHFTEGSLEGLKLIGFAIWERRGGSGRNVTFPARQYSINGERRSFALLRPTADGAAQDRIRDTILRAFEQWEHIRDHAEPVTPPGAFARDLAAAIQAERQQPEHVAREAAIDAAQGANLHRVAPLFGE